MLRWIRINRKSTKKYVPNKYFPQFNKRNFFVADLKKIGVILIICFIFIYFFILLGKLLIPPSIKIFFPKNNVITKDSVILVKGKADLKAIVLVNGERINQNSDGIFEKYINLKPGVNLIKITAQKKYFSKINIQRKIIQIP